VAAGEVRKPTPSTRKTLKAGGAGSSGREPRIENESHDVESSYFEPKRRSSKE
jgi:hypothetical protein